MGELIGQLLVLYVFSIILVKNVLNFVKWVVN